MTSRNQFLVQDTLLLVLLLLDWSLDLKNIIHHHLDIIRSHLDIFTVLGGHLLTLLPGDSLTVRSGGSHAVYTALHLGIERQIRMQKIKHKCNAFFCKA